MLVSITDNSFFFGCNLLIILYNFLTSFFGVKFPLIHYLPERKYV